MNYFFGKSKTNKLILLFALALTLVMGCKKDNPSGNEDPISYKAYISHNLVATRTAFSIKTLFQNLQVFYPEVAELTNKVEYDVEVYEVTYKTIFQGEEIEASGLVCIPIADGISFPIISFQNGTNTAHDEAPTKDVNGIGFSYLESAAGIGNIVIIPDYIGFGKSEQFVHPYLHKESTVLSVENLIFAAQEMINNKLINTQWNSKLYLMGYSQGGWSTLCTHKDIVNNSATGLSVTATACGAGPYDLSLVQHFMIEGITYPQPVYMAYSMISYLSLGLVSNPVTDFFNEPYATPLPSYFEGQYSNGEINALLNDTVAVLLANEFLTGMDSDAKYEDLRTSLSDNSVHGWNTTQSIRIYHGTIDNYVPPTTSDQLVQEFADAGAGNKVTYIPLEGLDHSTGAFPMILDALIWFTNLESGLKDNRSAYINTDGSKPQYIFE
jgi:predicted esterase